MELLECVVSQTADLCTLLFMQRNTESSVFYCQQLTLLYFVFLPIFSDWLKLISSSVMEDSCDTVSLEHSIHTV